MNVPTKEQKDQLHSSIRHLLATVDRLSGTDLTARSGLPGWTRAHVLTHIARSADSRSRLLRAARAGLIGCQYDSETSRAQAIEEGAARPAPIICDDLRQALDRLLTAIHSHPAQRWDAPGEWLGGGLGPVRGAITSMRREIEYHHVDLAAGYQPADWPQDFADDELHRVSDSMTRRADAPVIGVGAGPTLIVMDGNGQVQLHGDAADLLAWLTGRPVNGPVRRSPDRPVPALPLLG